jgi:hypothetical protein
MRKSWIISGTGQFIFLTLLFINGVFNLPAIISVIAIIACIFFDSLANCPIPFIAIRELLPDYVGSLFQGMSI